jgi:UDP-N-acetylglucosamine acyltransferase
MPDRLNSYIHHNVIIEEGVYIGPGCIIGYPAENIATWPNEPGKVIIRSGAIITGSVTIDSGTQGFTEIGPDCFIMKGVHIGHDSVLGKQVRIAPGAKIGGFVSIHERTMLGMNCVINPRVSIPALCMIGSGAIVLRNTSLGGMCTYVGNPARFAGLNIKGRDYWVKHDKDNAQD